MQALNNWGLVLQELSSMAADQDRGQLVRQSVQKFRKAIRLRPEFDRACYNLGTVYYSHAHMLSSAAAAQLSSQLTKVCSARCLTCIWSVCAGDASGKRVTKCIWCLHRDSLSCLLA